MNKHEREIVLGYHLNGYSAAKIARITGYCANSIRNVIKAAGLLIGKKREEYIKNKDADITAEMAALFRKSATKMSPTVKEAFKKEVVRLYRIGVDIKTMSTIFNKSVAYIKSILKKSLDEKELFTERAGKKDGREKRLKSDKFVRRTDLYITADDRWTEERGDS